jgi:ribonuclease P protein component
MSDNTFSKAMPPKAAKFPKAARVTRSDDFTAIIRRGAYAADDIMVVNVRWRDKGAGEPARLGISIPKKTGNAPVRNRWKRWFREAFRTRRGEFPLGIEIIVRPKRDAVGSFERIDRSFVSTVKRAVRKLPQPRAVDVDSGRDGVSGSGV